MIQNCFTGNMLGSLLTFKKEGITAVNYIITLQQGLLSFIEGFNRIDKRLNDDEIQVAMMRDYIFMQDNASIHKAISTKNFFNSYNLIVID